MISCPFCNVIVGGGRPVGRVRCRCGRYQIRDVGPPGLAFTLSFRSGGRAVFHDIELSPHGFCYATVPDGRSVAPKDVYERMREAIDLERVSDVMDS